MFQTHSEHKSQDVCGMHWNNIYIKKLIKRIHNIVLLAIQKQRLSVDQTFNKGMEKYTKLEQAHLHQKVETIKERANLNGEALTNRKDQGRKVELQKYNYKNIILKDTIYSLVVWVFKLFSVTIKHSGWN